MDSRPSSSESPSPPSRWRSTRGPSAANRGGCRGRRNFRRDAPAGRVVAPIDGVARRRRSAPHRVEIQFHAFEDYSSPSPPRSPSRIRLPISPRRYDALRSPSSIEFPVRRPRHGTPPLSPPIADEWQRRRRSPEATPPRAMGSPTQPWRLLPAPISDPLPRIESPPLSIAIAKEEEGPEGSDSCSLGPPKYYCNGMPIWLPFHPSTESWAAMDAEMASSTASESD